MIDGGTLMRELSVVKCIENEEDISCFLDEITVTDNTKKKLEQIFERIEIPITVIVEKIYVDRVYRDIYYSVLSGKHFEYSRDCRRISIFKGKYNIEDLYEKYKTDNEILSNAFVGTIVLRPLKIGEIGRTLLNPNKLNIPKSYIRTAKYEIEVLGMIFCAYAFPFSEQDSEVMTCAETTMWSILEYYGTRYSMYKTVLPSEIIKNVDEISKQRVTPSGGLDYYSLSMVLKKFGFQPKIFSCKEYEKNFRCLFHYYVESGIPIAVGVNLPTMNAGHSIVCIGHSDSELLLPSKDSMSDINGMLTLDTSYFYKNYVIIDDNQIPYTIEDFNNLTLYSPSKAGIFVVPLYKRIYMDACKASIVFDNVIKCLCNHLKKFICHIGEIVDKDNPIIKRVFLTASRRYKEYRAKTSKNYIESYYYGNLSFPKFIWVMEISTYNLYKNQCVIGEVVLDATSSRGTWFDFIIMMRIMNHVGTRLPNNMFNDLIDEFSNGNNNFSNTFPIYKNNLKVSK